MAAREEADQAEADNFGFAAQDGTEVGFELVERGIPRHDHPVLDEAGKVVGKVTSGTMSPTLQKPIGMAYVPASMAKEGSPLWVDIRGKALNGVVVKLPFLSKP
jgi:aminomethyltransferase